MNATIIVSSVGKSKFMQSAGVFENFKFLIEDPMELEFDPQKTDLAKISAAIESSGEWRVVARWCAETAAGAYYAPQVTVYSNGRQWAMADQWLRHLGFPLDHYRRDLAMAKHYRADPVLAEHDPAN